MNKKRIQQIKCLFTLVFAACTLFHAARSYAQTTQVTISQENVPMERVMNEIEKQTGYLFLSNNDVDIRRNVSVRIENCEKQRVCSKKRLFRVRKYLGGAYKKNA